MATRDQLIQHISDLKNELKSLEDKLENNDFDEVEVVTSDSPYNSDNILKAIPDIVFIIDKENTIINFYSNDESLLASSVDNIIGNKVTDLLPENIGRTTQNKIKEVLYKWELVTYNYSLELNDSVEHFEARILPYNSSSVLVIVKKVSDIIRHEKIAAKQRDYLFGVMNISPVGILQLDIDGKLVFVNLELLRMMNKHSIQPNNDCEICRDLIANEFVDFSHLLHVLRNSISHRYVFKSEVDSIAGQTTFVLVRAMLVKNPITGLEEVFLYVEDISDLMRTNDQLQDSMDQLAITQQIGRLSYWEYDRGVVRGFRNFLQFIPEFDVADKLKITSLYRHIHEDDRSKFVEFVTKFNVSTGYRGQFRIVAGENTYWIEIRSRSINVKSFSPSKICGSIQDITYLKQQELLLKENQEFLDLLLERLPVAVYVKDAETREYFIWNRASEILFGIPKSDVLGKSAEEFYSENFAKLLNERDDQSLNSGVGLEFIEEVYEIKNTKKYINSYQVPVAMSGKNRALLGIAIDITGKKLVENQLKIAKEQAEKSDKLKSSFLANMSHEIRNPMNTIVGFSKILVEDEDLTPEDKEEFIGLINSNARHLLTLISDIIDIAKIENNKLKIFKQDIKVNSVMARLRPIVQRQLLELGKTDIQLSLEMDLPDNDCLINTDEQRFVQILNNLLGNAIRFTSQGEIKFGYRQTNLFELEFFVQDTGIGISDEDQKRIFTEFHQVGDIQNQKGGKGLGLSISKELINYLGGRIWVESELSKGTCFRFTLPRDVAKMNIVETNVLEESAIFQENKSDWSEKNILLVDDSKDILSFVSILLKKTQIRIFEANNGKEAVDMVSELEGKVDVILMDIQMPVLNGVNAMKIIKGKYPSIPVFAQTAFALEGDEQKFLKEGFDDYVPKPVNKRLLFRKLQSIFENN